MRKKILNFTVIAVMVFFVACSNEELVPDINTETGRTLSLTASMPEEGPSTRVTLTQDGNNIAVSWQIDDEIQLLFVQGTALFSETVTVNSISNNGKKAHFEIPIPQGAIGEFTLYGVYGGGGIDYYTSPSVIAAVLPSNPDNVTLAEGQDDIMLYFEINMNATDTHATADFIHLGSVFNISFNNITQVTLDFLANNPITEVRLVGVDQTKVNWAFNSNVSQYFDLVSKEFKYISTSPGNYISFSTADKPLIIGQTTTIRGWYPPLNSVAWPELAIQLIDSNGTAILTSSDTKPERTAPVAGMSYNFYAEFDGESLSFAPVVVVP